MTMPVIGTIFALVRVVILARGSFGAATISSGSSSTSYRAIRLPSGEGHPAALFFLVVAVCWPLTLVVHLFS